MWIHPSRGRAWARACLLVATSLIVIPGLYVIAGTLIESNRDGLGKPLGDLDVGMLMVVIFLGPWWVMRGLPTPPTTDGPPRGGILPFPTRTPAGDGEGTLDDGEEPSGKAARRAHHRSITRARLPRRRVVAQPVP